MDSDIKYAIYPGSVTLYNGTVRSFTALELATAYGVQDEDYLTVTSDTQLPDDPLERMKYIELRPRQDDVYIDMKVQLGDDDDESNIDYRPDFDATKTYTEETNPNYIPD